MSNQPPAKPEPPAATQIDQQDLNSNDTVEYWRSRAITAELKVQAFGEEIAAIAHSPEGQPAAATIRAMEPEGAIRLGEPIPATVNGEPGRVAFFTKEAAEAYRFKVEAAGDSGEVKRLREARRLALEEAAQVAENCWKPRKDIADLIRALASSASAAPPDEWTPEMLEAQEKRWPGASPAKDEGTDDWTEDMIKAQEQRWPQQIKCLTCGEVMPKSFWDSGMHECPTTEKPIGFAYRYADALRFDTGGREINGGKPLAVIPLYTRPQGDLTADKLKQIAMRHSKKIGDWERVFDWQAIVQELKEGSQQDD